MSDIKKLKNTYNNWNENERKINEIIENGGGGGGGFTPTEEQLAAMNSGITSTKVDQINVNKNNTQLLSQNKLDKLTDEGEFVYSHEGAIQNSKGFEVADEPSGSAAHVVSSKTVKAVKTALDIAKLDKRTTGNEVYSHNGITQEALSIKTEMSTTAADTNILTEKAIKNYGASLVAVTAIDNPGNINNGSGLSNGTNYDSSVNPQLVKIGKFAFFTCQLKWTAEGAISTWTTIYTLSSGNRPAKITPIIAQIYNGASGLNESAGGTINTAGQITLWTNPKQGTNNYQIRINCCFKLA